MTGVAHQKVNAGHLKRNAYLYVRQSTLRQVFENTESTKRQYGLRQHAVALGWPVERIIVIDSDLGQSGASAVDREGFQKLVSEVGLGKAGIVLGLEVSRLARNSTDWHRLLEICALTDTLILDEDGVYDPSHFNDRLLLGLKGTMSEAELHVLRARLQGRILSFLGRAARSKASVLFVCRFRTGGIQWLKSAFSWAMPKQSSHLWSRSGVPSAPGKLPILSDSSLEKIVMAIYSSRRLMLSIL